MKPMIEFLLTSVFDTSRSFGPAVLINFDIGT
jgi:hypothetical protein